VHAGIGAREHGTCFPRCLRAAMSRNATFGAGAKGLGEGPSDGIGGLGRPEGAIQHAETIGLRHPGEV